ncbi:MAG: glycoside hydrolase family 44 protein [Myxococcales bacterium]|nr:glycoside hydrolase family 44 protein [Myxococcales bacterium]
MRHLQLASVVVLVSCNGLVSALDGGALPPPGDELSGRTADGGFSNGGGSAVGGGASAGGAAMGGGASSLDLDEPLTPGSAGLADVTLEVRSNRGRHAISPLIYGTNQPANPTRNRYALLRLGGNRLTAFNWENNASNAGSDYQFQNDGYLSSSNVAGALLTDRLTAARSISAALLATVPIVDFVAADKNGGGDVRNSGPNYLTTRFKQNRHTKPSPISLTPDSSDAFVYQDEFVAWVRANAGTTPVLFSLDNEPDLWSDTHAEIHPAALTYVELTTRSIDYAKAIKRAWPDAPVTGFVSYGWNGYVNLQNAPDRAGKGEFIDYFLAQVRMAEQAEGKRLVDYLDLHWYPEARGGTVRIIGRDVSAASITARVQAPRSLWDPSYVESSWIVQTLNNQAVRLLPRMREKIARLNPGTKLAFTEWNYGAGDHISGAVATADVLGIFGRDSVELATHWKLNGAEPFADAAFEAFRNFDGQGGAFADTSLEATSSQVAMASIYASVDAANPGRTVLVVINKDITARTAAITVAHPQRYQSLVPFTLSGSMAQLMRGQAVMATATNAFRYPMPPLSVSVLVLQP